jgi:hypothetical protein
LEADLMADVRLLTLIVGLLTVTILLTITAVVGLTMRPGLDMTALLIPPSLAILVIAYDLSGRIRVDITPITATPLAYTQYHMAAVYLSEVSLVQAVAYSILVGSLTTILVVLLAYTVRVAVRRVWR